MIVLRASQAAAVDALVQVRRIAMRFPGVDSIRVEVGDRTLTIGDRWRCEPVPECVAALEEYGEVSVC